MFLQVIQWATYHKDDPPPPEDDENKEKRTDDISSWDADFLKVGWLSCPTNADSPSSNKGAQQSYNRWTFSGSRLTRGPCSS